MKKKRKYFLPRVTLLYILFASIFLSCVYATYAWVQISSMKGIYPYYEVQFTTPTDSFYVKVEVAVDEVYNEETNDYDTIYQDIREVDLSQKSIYPGDRLNFRFLVYNFGGQDTSISIYFKNIIDTLVSEGEEIKYLSEDIILGSPSFNGNSGKAEDNYGFLFYASERMSYLDENLTPAIVEGTVCENENVKCFMNNSNVKFANNVHIEASSFKPGYDRDYFDSKIEELKQTSTNFDYDRQELVFQCFEPTELNWYMLLDRESTIETANSLFRIGTIFFAVD